MDAAKSRLSHGRLEFASMWVLQCRTFVFWTVLVRMEDRKGKSRRKSCLALVQFHNGRKCIYQRDVPKRLEYIWEKASMQSLVHSCCDEIPEKKSKENSANAFSRSFWASLQSRPYFSLYTVLRTLYCPFISHRRLTLSSYCSMKLL